MIVSEYFAGIGENLYGDDAAACIILRQASAGAARGVGAGRPAPQLRCARISFRS